MTKETLKTLVRGQRLFIRSSLPGRVIVELEYAGEHGKGENPIVMVRELGSNHVGGGYLCSALFTSREDVPFE